MTTSDRPLLDRVTETKALDDMVAAVGAGGSGVLVLRGESGVGKTALLDHAVATAATGGVAVARVAGVEAELDLSFAVLHQLVAPMLGGIDDLPAPRRAALETAFGLAAGGVPDRFLVGLAVLALLEAAAAEGPLMCVVDDAQWLDDASAETLAFVARRLDAPGLAFVFSVREPAEERVPLQGLPEVRVEGLPSDAARALVVRASQGPVNDLVCALIVARGGGNAAALLGLMRELTPAQLAGASSLPDPLPLGAGALEHDFVRRLRRLPPDTRALLLLLSAERAGDASVLWRGAARLDLAPSAVDAAQAEGLVSVGTRVVFRHPLLRAAIYGDASMDERRRTHRALVAAIDAAADPDERAWHRAAGSASRSETIAAELERSARRVAHRAGYAAAAALLARAAELTPDRDRRVERSLAAAGAELDAGAAAEAAALVADVGPDIKDPLQRARAQRLRVRAEVELGMAPDPPERILEAARALEPLDRRQARETHLEALIAACYVGGMGRTTAVLSAAQAARAAPTVRRSDATAADLLLDGYAALLIDGHGAAAPMFRQAIDVLRDGNNLFWLDLGCHAALELWDDEALHVLTERRVALARRAGAFTALRRALAYAGAYEVRVGRFDYAEAFLAEAEALNASADGHRIPNLVTNPRLLLAVWQGRQAQGRALAETAIRDAAARGQGAEASYGHYALALLELGSVRYPAALAAAQAAVELSPIVLATATLPELAEAAARAGRNDVAADAVRRLEETVLSTGTEWGLGVLARSRALVAEGREAEALHLQAIDHLGRCRMTPQHARAKLLYGEWLRRERRRRDAREQLRSAHQMFTSMGADGFAERAREELHATGERLRARTAETSELLTPQETRVARLAADGISNRDIADQLFISPRTVEYHVRKIFRKLGINSRLELARKLADS